VKNILDIVIKVYSLLIHLYPSTFRKEFEEQMLLDFSDMAVDAMEKGRLSFAWFCIHELIDFPINLWQLQWKEGDMLRMLGSRSVHYGLRGALACGVTFFLVSMINDVVFWKLDSVIGRLQVLYFDLFHTEHGLEFISWLSPAFTLLLSGLIFGMMTAVLFADRFKYARYILVGVLGFFLYYAVTNILMSTFNIGFFLGIRHTNDLLVTLSVLSGAFLALLFVIAKSDKQIPLRLLIAGTFAYPLSIYFYVQLLFKLGFVETPKMFIALMTLLVFYIVSVLVIAVKVQNTRRIPWIVIILAVGNPLLPYLTRFLFWNILPQLNLPHELYYSDPSYWRYILLIALQQAVNAIPLGFLVGMVLGFQRIYDSARTPT
jgi:hypothetical protein